MQTKQAESEIFYFLTKNHKIIGSPCYFLPRQSGASRSVNFFVLIQVFADIIKLLAFRLFGTAD